MQDWVPLGDLVPGDDVLADDQPLAVVAVERVDRTVPVYNLEVRGEHVYQVTADGVLVHNNDPTCLVDVITGLDGKPISLAPNKVNGRMPINADYAGKTYFDALPMSLQKKYPNGVKFDSKGFPDFSPYSKKSVEIKYTGSRTGDFDAANKAAGFSEMPKGYTWHHHQDVGANGVGRMELVPSDLHSEIRHTGGVARWQELFPGQGSY